MNLFPDTVKERNLLYLREGLFLIVHLQDSGDRANYVLRARTEPLMLDSLGVLVLAVFS